MDPWSIVSRPVSTVVADPSRHVPCYGMLPAARGLTRSPACKREFDVVIFSFRAMFHARLVRHLRLTNGGCPSQGIFGKELTNPTDAPLQSV